LTRQAEGEKKRLGGEGREKKRGGGGGDSRGNRSIIIFFSSLEKGRRRPCKKGKRKGRKIYSLEFHTLLISPAPLRRKRGGGEEVIDGKEGGKKENGGRRLRVVSPFPSPTAFVRAPQKSRRGKREKEKEKGRRGPTAVNRTRCVPASQRDES